MILLIPIIDILVNLIYVSVPVQEDLRLYLTMCGRARLVLPSHAVEQLARSSVSRARKRKVSRDDSSRNRNKPSTTNVSIGPIGIGTGICTQHDLISTTLPLEGSENAIGENISPGMPMSIVLPLQQSILKPPSTSETIVAQADNSEFEIKSEPMVWGLIPSSSTAVTSSSPPSSSEYYKMFNARIESVCEKTSFKRLVQKRRGVLILNGFYEWMGKPGAKIPFYVHLKCPEDGSDSLMFIPVLFDVLATGLTTFTMLTCDACEQITWLHNRQPVMLTTDEQVDRWLDVAHVNATDILAELQSNSYRDIIITAHEVSRGMTNPKYQEIDCSIESKQSQSTATTSKTSRKTMQSYFSPNIGTSIAKADHVDSSTTEKPQDEISCPICGTDLRALSKQSSVREEHVNACLNAMETSPARNNDNCQATRAKKDSIGSKRPRDVLQIDLSHEDND